MKPVQLVVTNTFYEIMSIVTGVGEKYGAVVPDHTAADPIARSILVKIATGCSLPVVMKALAAIGGPETLDDIIRQYVSTQEAIAREGKPAEEKPAQA
jgi:hypothetical protein